MTIAVILAAATPDASGPRDNVPGFVARVAGQLRKAISSEAVSGEAVSGAEVAANAAAADRRAGVGATAASDAGHREAVTGGTGASRAERSLPGVGGGIYLLDRPGSAQPAPELGLTVLHSAGIAADLRTLARLARQAAEPLLLCAADLVANDAVLLTLATEPGARSYALASPRPGVLVAERGRVTGVGGPGVAFLGALRIATGDLAAFAEAAGRAAGRTDAAERGTAESSHPAESSHAAGTGAAESSDAAGISDEPGGSAVPDAEPGGRDASAVDVVLPELVRGGVAVLVCRVRLLHAERVADPDDLPQALARVAAVDEEAARLRLAVKEHDDFFTTYFVSSYSPGLVRWAARRGLSPAAVTGFSMALAALAAGAFTVGSRAALVAGAVLLYASFVLDCVDGQLARYTRRFSGFGGWLDTMADRTKEYVVYAGLAAGAARTGHGAAAAHGSWTGTVWALALAAMVLQTVRHSTDTWYGLLHDEAVARRAGSPASRETGGRLGRVSDRVIADTGSMAYWLKRTVVFPIGERWLLIGLAAALFNGRVALIAVLVWGGLAAAYTLALRSLRSWSMRVPVLATVDIMRQRDDGPLARYALSAARLPGPLPLAGLAVLAGAALVAARPDGRWAVAVAGLVVLAAGLAARDPHAGALDWLVPAALRAAEYLFVTGAAVAAGVPLPLVFALLLVLALHHYDLTARASAVQPWRSALGWDGRVVVLGAGVLAGVATQVTAGLAAYVAVVFAAGALTGWSPARSNAQRQPPPKGQPSANGQPPSGAVTGHHDVHSRRQVRKV